MAGFFSGLSILLETCSVKRTNLVVRTTEYYHLRKCQLHSIAGVLHGHFITEYFCITHGVESTAREVNLPAPYFVTNWWQNHDHESKFSSFLLSPWRDNQEKQCCNVTWSAIMKKLTCVLPAFFQCYFGFLRINIVETLQYLAKGNNMVSAWCFNSKIDWEEYGMSLRSLFYFGASST